MDEHGWEQERTVSAEVGMATISSGVVQSRGIY